MSQCIDIIVAVWVLVPVEVVLEGGVVAFDQRHLHGLVTRQPRMGLGAPEGPVHDVEALIDDVAIGQDQYGHGALRAVSEETGRLVAKDHLPELAGLAGGPHGKSGAHRVGTAPKAVENGSFRCCGHVLITMRLGMDLL